MSVDVEEIKAGLKGYNPVHVENYIAYLRGLEVAKDKKTGKLKNPWMAHRQTEYIVRIFKAVADDGLVFDGVDITLQSTGVSYSYQAYKNKMLLAYPESVFDPGLVYEGDEFTFVKDSGKVTYTHKIANPFSRKDNAIIGAYCVIKNSRGDFITLLTKDDLEKHRKCAKTDYIWRNWFAEMCLKTVVKKGCKQHFKDVYRVIEEFDNENYDPDQLDEYKLTKAQVDKLMKVCEEKGFPIARTLEALARKLGYPEGINDVPESMYPTAKKSLDDAPANRKKAE
jgi:hypothetical protein